jgi:hypothetical protein
MNSSHAAPNNSLNPTALSLPFIKLVSCDAGCMGSSGGGLIRALGASLIDSNSVKYARCSIAFKKG